MFDGSPASASGFSSSIAVGQNCYTGDTAMGGLPSATTSNVICPHPASWDGTDGDLEIGQVRVRDEIHRWHGGGA
ncbi:hypothetical protein RHMOL_Rhmol09G0064600 [Rhododendron molle]|uniref:Uncharacterized protein n=1 Tax=Rhododendron molle TaxID=49168 RepID=A0ACC0MBL8_RHOML|nr:hypothetical protein RHMOL_Rhmol09G0064600 [Rhododendron molle]